MHASVRTQSLSHEDTRHEASAGLMLAQRLRRWANINPALAQYLFWVDPSSTTPGLET